MRLLLKTSQHFNEMEARDQDRALRLAFDGFLEAERHDLEASIEPSTPHGNDSEAGAGACFFGWILYSSKIGVDSIIKTVPL